MLKKMGGGGNSNTGWIPSFIIHWHWYLNFNWNLPCGWHLSGWSRFSAGREENFVVSWISKLRGSSKSSSYLLPSWQPGNDAGALQGSASLFFMKGTQIMDIILCLLTLLGKWVYYSLRWGSYNTFAEPQMWWRMATQFTSQNISEVLPFEPIYLNCIFNCHFKIRDWDEEIIILVEIFHHRLNPSVLVFLVIYAI